MYPWQHTIKVHVANWRTYQSLNIKIFARCKNIFCARDLTVGGGVYGVKRGGGLHRTRIGFNENKEFVTG